MGIGAPPSARGGASLGPRREGCRLPHSARSDRRDDRRIASGRGKLLRYAMAMCRDGVGRVNGTATTSLLWYLGVSASRGRTETPSPDATMLRTVSRDVVRVTCASARLSSGQASSTCSRKQWPTPSRIACSPASSSARIDFRRGPPVSLAAPPTWNGSSYRNSVATPRRRERKRDDRRVDPSRLQRAFEMLGEIFLQIERHLRRPLAQRGNQVGQQIRRDRVDDAELQRACQLVAARLGNLPDLLRLLEHPLRLLDDAPADGRHRDLALAAFEEHRAELVLELLDGHRQRRLADEAALGRPAEAPLVGDRDDVAKLVQRHRWNCWPRSRRNAAKSSASSGCLRP